MKKGYSGAGVYTRHEPDEVVIGFGSENSIRKGVMSNCVSASCRWCRCMCRQGPAAKSASRPSTRFMDEFMPHLAELAREREVIVCGDVNIVPQGNRHQELEEQSEELGLPAGRARVAHQTVRRSRLRRRLPHARPAARAIYVVEQSRPGVCEERGVADRLSDRDAGHRKQGETHWKCFATSVQRPRAADGRLRPRRDEEVSFRFVRGGLELKRRVGKSV